ncbi:MAG: hypothetical protein WA652_13300 [Xanthobacteraceae bacterium]
MTGKEWRSYNLVGCDDFVATRDICTMRRRGLMVTCMLLTGVLFGTLSFVIVIGLAGYPAKPLVSFRIH